MKAFSKLLISAVTVATCGVLTPTSGYSYSHEPITVEIPDDSDKSCEEALTSVTAELADRGFFVPWDHDFSGQIVSLSPKLTSSTEEIERDYAGYPEDRLHSVTFYLSGEASRVDSLMGSPQLMAIYIARIMADCHRIGVINFNHWWEGYIPIGYFPDHTARMFTYVNHGPRDFEGPPVYQWGTYFSH